MMRISPDSASRGATRNASHRPESSPVKSQSDPPTKSTANSHLVHTHFGGHDTRIAGHGGQHDRGGRRDARNGTRGQIAGNVELHGSGAAERFGERIAHDGRLTHNNTPVRFAQLRKQTKDKKHPIIPYRRTDRTCLIDRVKTAYSTLNRNELTRLTGIRCGARMAHLQIVANLVANGAKLAIDEITVRAANVGHSGGARAKRRAAFVIGRQEKHVMLAVRRERGAQSGLYGRQCVLRTESDERKQIATGFNLGIVLMFSLPNTAREW